MANSYAVIALAALLVVGALCAWKKGWFHCDKGPEGYSRLSLSQKGPFKRMPSTTAFRGNGMNQNPHYVADPADRLVPLEYGGTDFYKSERRDQAGKSFEEFGDCYQGRGNKAINLINDDKTRRDLTDAGDLGWVRVLQNLPNHFHVEATPVTTEDDLDKARVKDFSYALYDPMFHFHIGS